MESPSVQERIDQSAYEAAHHAAVMADRSQLGMLKITGQTRLDLLQRMSTQAVAGLQRGQGAATILTSDIARIIDRLILYVSTDTVYALTSENNADNIARYLMRYVFFQDDFHMEDISADTVIFGIYGPEAKERLIAFGFPEVDIPLHHWRQAQMMGVTVYLHRTDPVAGDGYFVMCQSSEKEMVRQKLLGTGLVPVDDETFELLRIESKVKRLGHELSLDYIPLEADLWEDVSFTKGCFIGQEIIARMESRGRLAKRLARLYPVAPVEIGAEITAEGKVVGRVTSAAVGPGGSVALGFVKTAVLDGGAPLQIGGTKVSRAD